MDWSEIATLAAGSVITVAVPVVVPYLIGLIRARIHNERLARALEGATMAAGRVIEQAAVRRRAGAPEPIPALLKDAIQHEVLLYTQRYEDTLKSLGADPNTAPGMAAAQGMVHGKIGELMARAPVAAPVVPAVQPQPAPVDEAEMAQRYMVQPRG